MDDQNNQYYLQDKINILKNFLLKNKSIIIVVAILSLMSFSTTGYLLISNEKSSLSNQPPLGNTISNSSISPVPSPKKITSNISPSITLTPSPTITTDAASWSAYISSKYSYSIKYPPNWDAKTTAQQDPKILEYVVFNPIATKAGTLSITLAYGNRTYAQALALDPQVGESMLIASVSAIQKSSKDSNGYKAINVIVPFGQNTIIFNAKDAFEDLFNQMLTTLNL